MPAPVCDIQQNLVNSDFLWDEKSCFCEWMSNYQVVQENACCIATVLAVCSTKSMRKVQFSSPCTENELLNNSRVQRANFNSSIFRNNKLLRHCIVICVYIFLLCFLLCMRIAHRYLCVATKHAQFIKHPLSCASDVSVHQGQVWGTVHCGILTWHQDPCSGTFDFQCLSWVVPGKHWLHFIKAVSGRVTCKLGGRS